MDEEEEEEDKKNSNNKQQQPTDKRAHSKHVSCYEFRVRQQNYICIHFWFNIHLVHKKENMGRS